MSTYSGTDLTGTAADAVANKSTGGEVSMVLAGVELGDVTVVTGEDCKERAQHRSTEVHRNPTGQWGLARKPTPFPE